ncbi:acetyltransferase [Vibrio cholerae]|nr:acetyltransferase [Vibrio cholerae]EGQ7881107.1 acetyltransferase [Vibrio cholerae]EGQ9321839.1 acetyltransferase [Vibrio cholerae]EGQ9436452.1 acetyltransferase [Vibrio cholerae]EGQ9634398.1 acetyltransferase [Vibrio cholerae]EGQ9647518.1 acetyltransferase [Vibrio cholerae]
MNVKPVSKNSLGSCAILGASGHGKVIAEMAELNGYSDIHFYDDRWPSLGRVELWQVSGNSETLLKQARNYANVVVAIGNNATRLEKYNQLVASGASCLPLVHPSAIVSRYANVENGTVVMAGAVINPFSRIGQACIINTAATVDHDCVIEDGVHLSPGVHLAGGVEVAQASWLGIGCQIKQLIKIGSNAVVAAGATVINDVLANQMVVGVPAKPICSKEL